MKKLFILLFILILNYLCHSQEWIRYYGFGQQPYNNYCLEYYDKGYLLAGSVNTAKYGWLIKTDINGNQLWDLKIGDGINQTNITNVEITSDKGLILCGSTTMFSPSHSVPYIMKLNSCGDLEWCKALVYDATSDWGYGVKPTADGGYVLLGEFLGNDPDNRFRLFKFDSTGEILWYKIYNGDSLIFSENVHSFIADSLNFLITGFCYYPNWIKPYYIQIDTTGNEIWGLVYSQHTGLGYVGDAWATVKDIHGNYYSAGRRAASPELIKFSGQGYEMMNIDLFPTAESGSSRVVLLLSDTICIIDAGWSLDGVTNYYALLKTDTLGSIKKIKYLPDPDNSGSTWASKTKDNKVLLIGMNFIGANSRMVLSKFNSNLEYDSIYTRHFTYDSLCPDTIHSHTINPSCEVLVGLKEPIDKPEISALKVFPNPANRQLTVEFPKYIVIKTGQQGFGSTTIYHKWKSTTLEVFDLIGKKVLEKEIIRAQTSLNLDVSGWQRGMYYFRLVYKRQTIAGEKVIVE